MKAILLAAGNSKRFGGNKLLEPLRGRPLYQHTLELVRQLPFDEVILVTQYQEIIEREKGKKISLVYNGNPEKGISESIRLGVRQAGKGADLIFFVCDQPYLKKETVLGMIQEFEKNPTGIVCSKSDLRSGNPNIFGAEFYEEFLKLEHDTGGKKIIQEHPDAVRYYFVREKELLDIDYKKDFAKEIYFEKRSGGNQNEKKEV